MFPALPSLPHFSSASMGYSQNAYWQNACLRNALDCLDVDPAPPVPSPCHCVLFRPACKLPLAFELPAVSNFLGDTITEF
jgi:hypothetical protein